MEIRVIPQPTDTTETPTLSDTLATTFLSRFTARDYFAAHAMERFADHEILELLDDAGASFIHRVRPRSGGPDLVLKRLKPHAQRVTSLLDQFLNEVEITMLLKHPNIIRGLAHGILDGQHYVLLEFVDGPDAHRLTGSAREALLPKDLGLSIYITVCILRALAHAHGAVSAKGRPLGVVHRDVSPDNFLCTLQGEVKLADFGIAKLTTLDVTTDPALGIRGKLAYMAPERLRGEPFGPQADQFSAALCLLELYNRHPVYQKTGEEDLREIVARADVDVPGEIPKRVAKVMKKALEFHPKKRHKNADVFADELTEAARKENLVGGPKELSSLIGRLNIARDQTRRSVGPRP